MKGAIILIAVLALTCSARNVKKAAKQQVHKNDYYTIQFPEISLMKDGGLKMTYSGECRSNGKCLVDRFSVHYSINKDLEKTNEGEYNFDVTETTDNLFVHENAEVKVAAGDVVNYWIAVERQRKIHYLVQQSWTPTASKATKAKKAKVPSGKVTDPADCTEYPCLIFNDDFDFLDMYTWQHEISQSGGGNWEFQYYTNNRSNSYTKDGLLYIKPTLTSEKYGEAFLTSGTLDQWGMAPPNYCTANAFWGCMREGNPTNIINPIQSARIRSVHGFNMRYGKVEVEAQMPKGDWIWPAIWMLPEKEAYGEWPASGEIDLVESRGNLDMTFNGEEKGNGMAGQTLHWGPHYDYNEYARTAEERIGTFADAFHRYGMEWDDQSLKLFIDDELVLDVTPGDGGFWEYGAFNQRFPDENNPWRYSDSKMAPFDQPMYFLINVAVGGTNGFFPDEWTSNPPKPWSNLSPQAFKDFYDAKNSWYPTWNADVDNGEQAAMKVNYVRAWKMRDD